MNHRRHATQHRKAEDCLTLRSECNRATAVHRGLIVPHLETRRQTEWTILGFTYSTDRTLFSMLVSGSLKDSGETILPKNRSLQATVPQGCWPKQHTRLGERRLILSFGRS